MLDTINSTSNKKVINMLLTLLLQYLYQYQNHMNENILIPIEPRQCFHTGEMVKTNNWTTFLENNFFSFDCKINSLITNYTLKHIHL